MAAENSLSWPWRSEFVKKKQIDLITISDDEYEEDQNHTSPSSEVPQNQIPNPISATSFTMFPGISVPINAALNKVESDYIHTKSETTVQMDQPPFPVCPSLPPLPPLPQVVFTESPPCGEFPLLPPPPQFADHSVPLGSNVQAKKVISVASRHQLLQSASSSRNLEPSRSSRVKQAVKVKSRKQKEERTHKMRLRETTLENVALQQQQSHTSNAEDEDDSPAIRITNMSKILGGNQEKSQQRAGRSQQKPRFVKPHDKNLTRVTPAEGRLYYVCKFCERTFSYHSNGRRHVRIHTGDKPFKCSYCHKVFSLNCNLKEHESIHTGIKSLKCKFCSKMFRNQSSRSKHHHICVKKKFGFLK